MYYISSFLLIPKDSRVLLLSVRYASLAFRSRQACPANRVTYGLVPEQIVTEKIQLRFLNGGRSLQLNRFSTFSVGILDPWSSRTTIDPDPAACDLKIPGLHVFPDPAQSLAFDPWTHRARYVTLRDVFFVNLDMFHQTLSLCLRSWNVIVEGFVWVIL